MRHLRRALAVPPATSANVCRGSRCFAVAASKEEGTSRAQVFIPPGPSAKAEKVRSFRRLVSEALAAGSAVELNPLGVPATWHALRALASDPSRPEFQVNWFRDASSASSSDRLRVLAKPSLPLTGSSAEASVDSDATRSETGAWWDSSRGLFVSNQTETLPLARKVAIEFRKADSVALHTFVDAERAATVILRALASARGLLEDEAELICTASEIAAVATPADSSSPSAGVPRLRVYAVKEVKADESEAEGNVRAWPCYPPGAGAKEDALRRFTKDVKARLSAGQPVVMECRGKEAALHAVKALASARGRVAEFEAAWVDAYSPGKSSAEDGASSKARAPRLRAVTAERWEEFNATNFSQTRRLTDTSSVKDLAKTIATEVQRRGGVAIHVLLGDLVAISNALKALASVSTESNGRRVVCVPSFGPASGDGDHSKRLLRFYVRARDRSAGQVARKRHLSESLSQRSQSR